MSSSPDSAEFHTKLVFLTCFRTCGGNEPEELLLAESKICFSKKNIRSNYTIKVDVGFSAGLVIMKSVFVWFLKKVNGKGSMQDA